MFNLVTNIKSTNMKQTSFISQLISRLFTQSPDFFKKYRHYMVILLSILGVAALSLENNLFPSLSEETINTMMTIIKYVSAALAGGIATSSTTTTSAELIDDKTKINIIKEETGAPVNS